MGPPWEVRIRNRHTSFWANGLFSSPVHNGNNVARIFSFGVLTQNSPLPFPFALSSCMVGVVSSSLQAASQPGSFGLVWGSAAPWRRSIFITWTGWTLAVALLGWQHHKHSDAYYSLFTPHCRVIPALPYAPSWKISNGHISGTGRPIDFVFDPRVGFSGTANRMDLLPVGPNPRWRLAAILENFEWP